MALLLKGARCIDPQVGLDAVLDVLVDEGVIAEIAPSIPAVPRDAKIVDCTGMVLLPGLMDMHVHFRDPGQEYKETIAGGCRSAAKGGFTDVATMPNTRPVCDTGSVVVYQLTKAREANLTRVHPIGALTKGELGESLAELGDMRASGACAYSDDGRGVQTAGMLRTAMDYIRPFGQCVISHCQDESLAQTGVVNEGVVSSRLGLAGWPAQAEEIQIARDILLSELTGCPIHIAHVTTERGVNMVRMAREQGIKATCEVTPHHLFLCEDDITDDYDTNYKMNPPLRTRQDMLALQQALADGVIDCVVSDHAPHAAYEKELEFERAPFGIVGLESELPLILTHMINTGKLSWNRLVDAMCVKPREICALDPVMIARGQEATLTLVDPEKSFTLDKDYLESIAKNTPFLGAELKGCPRYAFVEGHPILWDGVVAAS